MPSSAIKPMKLPNSLTAPSNRGDAAPLDHRRKTHRWTPAILTLGWIVLGFWPVVKDFRAIVFLPFGLPLGFIHCLDNLGVPQRLQLPLSALLLILMFSLPWFSLLANSLRATTICTIGVGLLLLAQISGCQMLKSKYARITTASFDVFQAQRGSVRRPKLTLFHPDLAR
jgi:hypothetical protein